MTRLYDTMFDLQTQPIRQGSPQDAASLYMAFEKVQDRRKARGKRYPLPFILTLLFLGKLAGERTMSGALDWVNERKYWIKRALHWPKDIPVQSTCTEALTQCDDEEVTQVIAQFFEKEHGEREKRRKLEKKEGQREEQEREQSWKQTAMDGKTLKGTRKHASADQPSVHLLSLYNCETGIVQAQRAVPKKTNEITGAKAFFRLELLQGKLLSTDAMHTQKLWFAEIEKYGGWFFSTVKRNHKRVYHAISSYFEQKDTIQGNIQYARKEQKGHGRQEIRELWASTQCLEILEQEWRGIEQIVKIRRCVERGGKWREEIVYGVTSLPRNRADAEQLLEMNQKHWYIENRLHYRRDVTLGEDACQVRKEGAPQVLAALNGGILALMDYLGVANVAAQMRHFCAQPQEALQLLLSELPR
jgi:predicted transposase YbfD/YdcC